MCFLKITVPAQIIYGERSTLYSKETAEYLHSQIPKSKIIPFENCTHMLVAENPFKTTQVIEEMAGIKDTFGSDAIGFISSSKVTNEENYLVQKLSRQVFGTKSVKIDVFTYIHLKQQKKLKTQ